MRIAHVGDVHWRGLSRHEEFERAFTRMFDQMRALKPDAIAICGDIFDTKTQGISPEVIDRLVWWFRGLADICPTHVILGNHDGNLSNRQRQDAISPILNAMGRADIHLYKESGVYQFAPGFNWCVFSVFDEDGWDNVRPVPDEVNIALFHGTVFSGVTDQGYELESEMTVDFFDGYDFAFLGDLHQMQFLAYRDSILPENQFGRYPQAVRTRDGIVVKRPHIAYPGSTIQQNYGEDVGKGFLLWDIKSADSFDVEFHSVPHDRPFITVDWKGTLRETLDPLNVPKGARVRVRTDKLINQLEIKQLCSELQQVHSATEVVFKNDYTVDGQQISACDVSLGKDDLRNPQSMIKLFRGFFKPEEFTPDEWTRIDSMVESYLRTAIDEDKGSRNARWSIKRLEFENLWGYGKENVVDLSDVEGITGIFGPNRVGKSSIIGTLLYTLFNDTDRGSLNKLHIINSRKGHCRSKLLMSINDVDYVVERQSVRKETKQGKLHAVTNLNFAAAESTDASTTDLNGEQRTETEKEIRQRIGTSDDCLLTGIATQGDMNRFIEAGSTQRDKAVSRFLDLEIFDRMAASAKEDSSKLRATMKSAPDRDWDTLIKEGKAKIVQLKETLAAADGELLDQRRLLDRARDELSSIKREGVITQHDVQRAQQAVEDHADVLNQLKKDLKTKVSQYKVEKDELSSIRKQIGEIPIHELKNKLKSFRDLQMSVNDLKHRYEKEKTLLESKEKSAKKLLEVPCGDAFPMCKYIKDSHQDKQQLDGQKKLVDDSLALLVGTETNLLSLGDEKIESKIEFYSQLQKSETESQRRIERIELSVEQWKRDLKSSEANLKVAEEKLTDYISRVVDGGEDERLDELEQRVSDLDNVVRAIDHRRISFASELGRLESDVDGLTKERDKYAQVRSEWRLYEMFISACSKKGIPSQVISSQLPMINAEIARLLHGIVDFIVVLEKDDELSTTEIYLDYGDSKRVLETASGMEKMISSLAIRVALLNASSLPRPDFLILDEGFGVLDEEGLAACSRFLLSLKSVFKHVIVITHVDAVKEIADQAIEITRRGKDSFVQFN